MPHNLWHPPQPYQLPSHIVPVILAHPLESINPGGIPSGEAFGNDQVLVVGGPLRPVGIASGEAFGSTQVISGTIIEPSGIPSGEAFGTANITPHWTYLRGIPSGEAFGLQTVRGGPVALSIAGIPSSEAFGFAGVGKPLAPSGIPSSEAFGVPIIRQQKFISAFGIPSGEAFGHSRITSPIYGFGIPSGEAFGLTNLSGGKLTVLTKGIPSGEAFGQVSMGGMVIYPASFIANDMDQTNPFAPAEYWQVPTIKNEKDLIGVVGIPSGEAFGRPMTVLSSVFSSPPPEGVFSSPILINETDPGGIYNLPAERAPGGDLCAFDVVWSQGESSGEDTLAWSTYVGCGIIYTAGENVSSPFIPYSFKVRDVTTKRDANGDLVVSFVAEAPHYELGFLPATPYVSEHGACLSDVLNCLSQAAGWSLSGEGLNTFEGDNRCPYDIGPQFSSKRASVLTQLFQVAQIWGGKLVFNDAAKSVHLSGNLITGTGPTLDSQVNLITTTRHVTLKPLSQIMVVESANGVLSGVSAAMMLAQLEAADACDEYLQALQKGCQDIYDPCQSPYGGVTVKIKTNWMASKRDQLFEAFLLNQMPQVSYDTTAVDLSIVPGYGVNSVIEIGNLVNIVDSELGINDTVRCVRRQYNLLEPWKSTYQFSNEVPLVTNALGINPQPQPTLQIDPNAVPIADLNDPNFKKSSPTQNKKASRTDFKGCADDLSSSASDLNSQLDNIGKKLAKIKLELTNIQGYMDNLTDQQNSFTDCSGSVIQGTSGTGNAQVTCPPPLGEIHNALQEFQATLGTALAENADAQTYAANESSIASTAQNSNSAVQSGLQTCDPGAQNAASTALQTVTAMLNPQTPETAALVPPAQIPMWSIGMGQNMAKTRGALCRVITFTKHQHLNCGDVTVDNETKQAMGSMEAIEAAYAELSAQLDQSKQTKQSVKDTHYCVQETTDMAAQALPQIAAQCQEQPESSPPDDTTGVEGSPSPDQDDQGTGFMLEQLAYGKATATDIGGLIVNIEPFLDSLFIKQTEAALLLSASAPEAALLLSASAPPPPWNMSIDDIRNCAEKYRSAITTWGQDCMTCVSDVTSLKTHAASMQPGDSNSVDANNPQNYDVINTANNTVNPAKEDRLALSNHMNQVQKDAVKTPALYIQFRNNALGLLDAVHAWALQAASYVVNGDLEVNAVLALEDVPGIENQIRDLLNKIDAKQQIANAQFININEGFACIDDQFKDLGLDIKQQRSGNEAANNTWNANTPNTQSNPYGGTPYSLAYGDNGSGQQRLSVQQTDPANAGKPNKFDIWVKTGF